jgi:hypothetical protein
MLNITVIIVNDFKLNTILETFRRILYVMGASPFSTITDHGKIPYTTIPTF